MARFLSQHWFSCAAVQEEQLRLFLCIQSFPAEFWPHQMISSELWLLLGGAQLSSVSESLGAFIFFLKHENIRQTLGCPTYSSGRPPDSLCHLTGFLQLLRHLQLHCFWVLYRNIKSFTTILRTKRPSLNCL